ncbi:o-succinylbenzoate synthase [Salinirubellus salinus]|uniref:o-succinylbenzoate synthase n=1 Tax=Salinirubellus salinus TaxID=1364945 RepID=A0A9E7R6J0_9EURY|nr:o-succinylbenzoate synthase [Salinirubellus salinus]UWM55613.1 o-succinylbenzoate synthase [Salinirubellus salinus]
MRVEPFSLSLTRPLSTANGPIEAREGFLVHVEHAGETAVGEATPLPGWTESLEECRAALEAVADPVSALDEMGDHPAARHAVEMAVAGCEARSNGESLAAWLGEDAPAASVPVNATVGDDTPAQTAAAAREAVEAGFPAVKIKVGVGEQSRDRERLAAVRDACPAVELRADANEAWDRETAADVVEWAADLDLAYLEQPLSAADLSGHAALRGAGVGIALDESLAAHGLDAVLAADAADTVVLKPMTLGGPVAARTVARRAHEAGVDTVVTTTIDGAYARAAAVHLAASLPSVPACGLGTGALLATDLLDPDPVPVAEGAVAVPTHPGVC